jgi:hypothetical protein
MNKISVREVLYQVEAEDTLFGVYESCTLDQMLANVQSTLERFAELGEGYSGLEISKKYYGHDGAFMLELAGERLETDEEFSKRQAKEQKKARAAAAKKPTQDEAAAKIQAMFSSDEEMMAVLKRLAVR